MARTLEGLFQYLDGLLGRAPLAELTSELAELDIGCEDVAGFNRFSDQHYTRNLVRSSPWYYALVLCWKNGQRSPIHDHHGSTCGVRVLRGTLTEKRPAPMASSMDASSAATRAPKTPILTTGSPCRAGSATALLITWP